MKVAPLNSFETLTLTGDPAHKFADPVSIFSNVHVPIRRHGYVTVGDGEGEGESEGVVEGSVAG